MSNIPAYATVSLIRGSSVFNMSDNTYCRVTAMQGIGPMPVQRIVEQGPLQHGATDRGFRAQQRLIRLMLYFQAGDPTTYWGRREDLNEILEPTNALGQLRFDLGNGSRRQIDVALQGAVMDSRAGDAGVEQFAVDFLCPNPAFYDPNGKAVTFGIDYSNLSFQIPMLIPLGIGQTSNVDVSHTIQYGGSWLSYPYRIRIVGPITDCIVTNETTGEKLDFTGTTIALGDRRDIDLRYSYKTVKNAAGTNRIQDLTADSDLTSWHLATRREVIGGSNTITVTGTGATSETEVYMSYYEYYNGI